MMQVVPQEKAVLSQTQSSSSVKATGVGWNSGSINRILLRQTGRTKSKRYVALFVHSLRMVLNIDFVFQHTRQPSITSSADISTIQRRRKAQENYQEVVRSNSRADNRVSGVFQIIDNNAQVLSPLRTLSFFMMPLLSINRSLNRSQRRKLWPLTLRSALSRRWPQR